MTKRFLSILTTLVIIIGLVGVLPVGAEDIVNNKPELKTNGVWVNGYIGYDDNKSEYDYIPIYTSSTGKLTIDMQSFGRLYFDVLDSDYNSIYGTSTYYASSGNPENKAFAEWLEKGTYYLRISEYNASWEPYYSGSYRVKASFTSANSNEIEPNDTYLQAQSVSNGSTITGTITRVKNDEYDYYKIYISKQTKYDFYVSVYDSNVYYIIFILFDNNLNDITNYTTVGVFSDETKKFSYTLDKGIYYIRISRHDNSCKYILKFNPPKSSSKKSASSNPLIEQPSSKKPARVNGVFLKKSGKRKAKISWKKVSGAKGYQVKWATNKKFKKAKKKFTSKKTITLKKLNKKKYFVKVRAYKIKNGRKYFGKWSKKLKIIR